MNYILKTEEIDKVFNKFKIDMVPGIMYPISKIYIIDKEKMYQLIEDLLNKDSDKLKSFFRFDYSTYELKILFLKYLFFSGIIDYLFFDKEIEKLNLKNKDFFEKSYILEEKYFPQQEEFIIG